MLREFKAFALKGNMLELAVAVMVGGAFGKITTSLVNDIIMPPIGLLLNHVNFRDLYINLSGQPYESMEAARSAGAPTINYGLFFNTIIDFLIVAFIMFLVIRAYNRVRPVPAVPVTRECPYCLSQVAQKASRCPHCTSQLDQPPA